MLFQRVRTLYGSIILDTTYGYQAKDQDDEWVHLIEKVITSAGTYGRPGGNLVDIFPWLEWLPSWMPGTGYRALGRQLRQDFNTSRDVPYEFTKEQIANGIQRPSFLATQLDGKELNAEDEDMLKHAAQVMYAAGADTTVSAGLSFFLFMTLYPEVQAKAQAEIDSVIGSARLPRISDRDHLPYVNAVISEVLRCGEIVLLGLPHSLREDDVHDDFTIPKGSVIMQNIGFMRQDPRKYSHPQVFDPERFMGDKPELDPQTYIFGFGRRICPGRFFAENNLFLQCATVLSTLNVTKALDSHGNEITPSVAYTGFAIRHPELFPCKLQARSAQAVALLNVDAA
jgi:cytochrome P450